MVVCNMIAALFVFVICFLISLITINISSSIGTYLKYSDLVNKFIHDLKQNPDKFEYYHSSDYDVWLNIKDMDVYERASTICLDSAVCLNYYLSKDKQDNIYLHKDKFFWMINLLSVFYFKKIEKQLKVSFPELSILK